MKIKYEFDTNDENFSHIEYERYKQADSMAICLGKIADKVRYWYNKDDRSEISTDEIGDVIFEIINEYVDLEKLGY